MSVHTPMCNTYTHIRRLIFKLWAHHYPLCSHNVGTGHSRKWSVILKRKIENNIKMHFNKSLLGVGMK